MDRVESVFNKMKCSHYIWHYSLLKPDLAAALVWGDQTKRRESEVGEGKEKERKGKEWTVPEWMIQGIGEEVVIRSHD